MSNETKHFHAFTGLAGLYMPDSNEIFRDKETAISYLQDEIDLIASNWDEEELPEWIINKLKTDLGESLVCYPQTRAEEFPALKTFPQKMCITECYERDCLVEIYPA